MAMTAATDLRSLPAPPQGYPQRRMTGGVEHPPQPEEVGEE
jgi:hypothetical protein